MADLPWLHLVHDYLAYHAEHRPEQRAVVCGGEAVTYAALHARVRSCAAALIAAGIEPGDRVATICEMRSEFLVTFLAASMTGAVWTGINPRYRAQEIEHILRDASPRLLFSLRRSGERDLSAELGPVIEAVPGLDRVVALGPDEPAGAGWTRLAEFLAGGDDATADSEFAARSAVRNAGDPVLLVYTSGTTGRPKGALLAHEGLIGRAMTQARMWPCDPIRVVNFLPINHIGGVGFISFYCLVGGGTQFLERRFDAAAFVAQLRRERITIWIGLPTIFLTVFDQSGFDPAALPDLQWAVWSGAALPVGAVRTLRRMGCRIGSSYGLTESSGSVCYAFDDLDDEVLARSIGHPTPAGEVRVADASGRPVPRGERGEIQIRPEWAMRGYLGLDEASAQARTADGFVRSGDIGVIDASGRIELVGRTKEFFKSGGYNIYPREVEFVIEEHPLVAACVVVPTADPRFQEVGVAFIQPLPAAGLCGEDLRAWCAARLANYKVPKRFELLDRLPMLGIGKIDRQALRNDAVRVHSEAAGSTVSQAEERL